METMHMAVRETIRSELADAGIDPPAAVLDDCADAVCVTAFPYMDLIIGLGVNEPTPTEPR